MAPPRRPRPFHLQPGAFRIDDEFTPRSGKKTDPVTITGLNLDTPGTTVAFDSKNAEIAEQTPRELKVTVPDLGVPIPAGGSVQVRITVTTSYGSKTSTHQFSVHN